MADFDKVILPGKEGKIEAKLIGRKLHPGHFKKYFRVVTNDPDNQSLTLYLTGNVKKAFDLSKPLNLMGFTTDEIKGETLLSILLDKPVNITGYKWNFLRGNPDFNEVMGVKIKTLEKGKKYRINIWKKGEIEPGRYHGELVLKLDYPKLKEKVLSVNLTITPDVEVHPPVIFFGEMRMNKGVSKSFDRPFSVIATRGDSLKILKVVPGNENITVSTEAVRPGQAYRCTVRVRPKAENGTFKSSLILYTNYPGYKEIKVDIKGAVHVVEDKKK